MLSLEIERSSRLLQEQAIRALDLRKTYRSASHASLSRPCPFLGRQPLSKSCLAMPLSVSDSILIATLMLDFCSIQELDLPLSNTFCKPTNYHVF